MRLHTNGLIQIALSILLCAGAVHLLAAVPDWSANNNQNAYWLTVALCVIALTLALLRHIPWWQRALQAGLTVAGVLLVADVPGQAWAVGIYGVYVLALLLLALLLRGRDSNGLINLGVLLTALALMLLIIEIVAPPITQALADAQRQAAIAQAAAAAKPPLDQAQMRTAAQPTAQGSPQAEFIERGPGPWWGEKTGWGTSTDTTLRYWLDGVYDNVLHFNSKGFRGPDVPYDKPDDVFRILLLGDSFIEAREVAYEDTVYAQLQAMLADARTADGKRIEVIGVGTTGWGTLQAYLYYHHEGYKFSPDLVLHFFVINDVSDNHPTVFQPERGLDFAINPAGETEPVQVVQGPAQNDQTAYDPAARFIAALPGSNTAQLLRQIIAPPRATVTLSGDLTRLHPQTYIFVRTPEIAGYATAWQRTEQAYRIWSDEAAANGAQLMVVSVDFTVELITQLATYFAGQQEGWIWDVDLPTKRLADLLAPLDVPLIRTRAAYEAYAAPLDVRPYDALYYIEDGHWNPSGHRVTARVLADALHARNIISDG